MNSNRVIYETSCAHKLIPPNFATRKVFKKTEIKTNEFQLNRDSEILTLEYAGFMDLILLNVFWYR